MFTEEEKIEILKELEPVIIFNVRKLFNYHRRDEEDLIQETKTILYSKLDMYDAEKGSLSTFCQAVIRNNVTNYVTRIYRNWNNVRYNDEAVCAAADNTQNTQIENYFRQLECLARVKKDKFNKKELMFIKLLVERKTFEEIEQILNISKNYRLQLVYLLKKKIRRMIDNE